VKPLIDNTYILERFPGKGGWTYARIPEILQDKNSPFGWVKVRGTIDGYEIRKCHLMPMGNGKLFLPVKAGIRKKLKKDAGDSVRVILYPDIEPLEVPEEILECLKDDPDAYKFFKRLSDSEKNYYVNWITSAKKEETKVDRIAKTINRLSQKLKFYEKQ
jgi:hypothetical protein